MAHTTRDSIMTNNTPNHAAFASLFCLYVVRNTSHAGKVYTNTYMVRLDADGQPATNDKGFLLMSEVDAQTVQGLAAVDLGMVPPEHNASRKARTRWIALQIKGQDADTNTGVLNANCLEYVETLNATDRADLMSALSELRAEYEDDTTPRGVRRLYLDARDWIGKARQFAPRNVSHETATSRHATQDDAQKAHDNLMPWIIALHNHLTGDESNANERDTDNAPTPTTDKPSGAHAATEVPQTTRARLKSALAKRAPEYVPGSFLSRLADAADERETAQDDPSVFDMTDLDDLFSQI